jgi:hypothetical protein
VRDEPLPRPSCHRLDVGSPAATEARRRTGRYWIVPRNADRVSQPPLSSSSSRLEGILTAWTGRDRVHVEVIYDDGSLQRELDDRFGADMVAVTSALRLTGG